MSKTQSKSSAPRPSRPSVRGIPFEVVIRRRKRRHATHCSRHVPACKPGNASRPVTAPWHGFAREPGYRIDARVRSPKGNFG